MAFANYAAYLAALNLNSAADFQMSANTAVAAVRFGNYSSLFVPAPSTPTTSVALDKTSNYAINSLVTDGVSGRLSILGARLNPSGVGGIAVMLVDILNMSGGLSGIVTGAQSTNLPTAALTRYTDGVGVHAAIIIHSQIGSTATTVTVSYTNQDGTSGRTSTALAIGASGLREAGSLFRIPLQAGDTGIQAVASINLVGTTGTAGNIGVVLYKPLALLFLNDIEGTNILDCISTGRMVGQCNEVLDGACLSCFGVAAVGAQAINGYVLLGEA
jgi:hypothetical protein